MATYIRRREFIFTLGGAVAACPLAARAQQPAMPVIGFLEIRSPETIAERLRAFRQGLKETGYVEGENIAIDYRWAEQIERLPELAAELVRWQVAVIVTAAGFATARAAKDATTTIPIVFGVSDDPVKHGLVASLARPGGNLTGVNLLNTELTAKRLDLLREMLPRASRIAVLVNPANTDNTQTTLREVEAAAPPWACRSRFSMPARAARSMPRSPHSGASGPTPSSSAKTHFTTAAACNSPIGHRAMRCP
jgi:putative ABC transport system substrate-binding protein